MKTTASVQMPLATLKAVKEVLFSKTGGIDLTSIINDLSLGEDCDHELTAINVALVYNGYTPEIEKAPRYEYCYDCFYYKYKMIKHSLILNQILVERSEYLMENDIEKKMSNCTQVFTMSQEEWLQLKTSKSEVLEKIKQYETANKI